MAKYFIAFAFLPVLFEVALSIPMVKPSQLSDGVDSFKKIEEPSNVDNQMETRLRRDVSPYDSSELMNLLQFLTNTLEDAMDNVIPKESIRVRRQTSRSNSQSTVTTVTKQNRRRQEQDYWLHERLWREFYGYLAEFMSRNFSGSSNE